jgi:hypothetical protein
MALFAMAHTCVRRALAIPASRCRRSVVARWLADRLSPSRSRPPSSASWWVASNGFTADDEMQFRLGVSTCGFRSALPGS